MDTISRKRSAKRPAATLFDDVRDADRDAFHERVRSFAVEVAKRHGRTHGDLNAMLAALRGWHRTWAICAPNRIPKLDEAIVAIAVAAYRERAPRRHSAA